MKNLLKRLGSSFLALLMVLTLIPSSALVASADTVQAEVHTWAYSADGNVITATCTEPTCHETRTLTLKGIDKPWNGLENEAVFVKSEGWDEDVAIADPTISYTYTLDGGETWNEFEDVEEQTYYLTYGKLLDDKFVDKSLFAIKATAAIDDATASVEYTVYQGVPEITVTKDDYNDDDEESVRNAVDVKVVVKDEEDTEYDITDYVLETKPVEVSAEYYAEHLQLLYSGEQYDSEGKFEQEYSSYSVPEHRGQYTVTANLAASLTEEGVWKAATASDEFTVFGKVHGSVVLTEDEKSVSDYDWDDVSKVTTGIKILGDSGRDITSSITSEVTYTIYKLNYVKVTDVDAQKKIDESKYYTVVDESSKSNSLPSKPGIYVIEATFASKDIYQAANAHTDKAPADVYKCFEVNKTELTKNDATVELKLDSDTLAYNSSKGVEATAQHPGLSVVFSSKGDDINYTNTSVAKNASVESEDALAVTYKFFSDEECTQEVEPVAAGTYWVKAYVPENEYHYAYVTEAKSFEICKKDITSLTIKQDGWTFNDTDKALGFDATTNEKLYAGDHEVTLADWQEFGPCTTAPVIKYTYYKDEDCTEETDGDDEIKYKDGYGSRPYKPGTYYVKATIISDNWQIVDVTAKSNLVKKFYVKKQVVQIPEDQAYTFDGYQHCFELTSADRKYYNYAGGGYTYTKSDVVKVDENGNVLAYDQKLGLGTWGYGVLLKDRVAKDYYVWSDGTPGNEFVTVHFTINKLPVTLTSQNYTRDYASVLGYRNTPGNIVYAEPYTDDVVLTKNANLDNSDKWEEIFNNTYTYGSVVSGGISSYDSVEDAQELKYKNPWTYLATDVGSYTNTIYLSNIRITDVDEEDVDAQKKITDYKDCFDITKTEGTILINPKDIANLGSSKVSVVLSHEFEYLHSKSLEVSENLVYGINGDDYTESYDSTGDYFTPKYNFELDKDTKSHKDHAAYDRDYKKYSDDDVFHFDYNETDVNEYITPELTVTDDILYDVSEENLVNDDVREYLSRYNLHENYQYKLSGLKDYVVSGTTSANAWCDNEDKSQNYTLTLTGKGNYCGTMVLKWGIAPIKLNASVEVENLEYKGNSPEPVVNGNTYNGEVSFKYYKYDKDAENNCGVEVDADEVTAAAGTYVCEATIASTTKTAETKVYDSFYVHRAHVTISVDSQSKIYGELDPEFTYTAEVTSGEYDDEQLQSIFDELAIDVTREEGEDVQEDEYNFIVEVCGEYLTVSTKDVSEIESVDNYVITLEPAQFIIDPKDVNTMTTLELAKVNYAQRTDKKAVSPVIISQDNLLAKGTRLRGLEYPEDERDIRLEGCSKAYEIGKYTVTVQGQNNYTGFKSFDWSICSAQDAYAIDDQVYTYNGYPQELKVDNVPVKLGSIITNVNVAGVDTSSDYTLEFIKVTRNGVELTSEDTDYVDAGIYVYEYALTQISTGNVTTGSVVVTINPFNITKVADITLGESLIYNCRDQYQDVQSVVASKFTLDKNCDYVVTNNRGVNAGKYTLTVTGIGNFIGSVKKDFVIEQKDISEGIVIADIAPLTYNGLEQTIATPYVTYDVNDGYDIYRFILEDVTDVNDDGKSGYIILDDSDKGTDAKYEGCHNGDNYTLTIQGVGNYKGTLSKSFEILPKDISDISNIYGDLLALTTVKMADQLVYNTVEQTQLVDTVKVKNYGITELPILTLADDDYILEDNTATYVGRYTLTVNATAAKGNYCGTKTADFTVDRRDVAEATITLGDQLYNNSYEQIQSFTVKYAGQILVENVDYQVVDDSNKALQTGDYTLTIRGIGQYTGTQSVNFTVTDNKKISVYRLYNPGLGVHHYTSDKNEVETLVAKWGWKYEEVAFTAYAYDGKDVNGVYRLYNAGLSQHLLTSDLSEVKTLTSKYGWTLENNGKPCFYLPKSSSNPIYRLYNPYLNSEHLYTSDLAEYNRLPAYDWKQEGVGFYGL